MKELNSKNDILLYFWMLLYQDMNYELLIDKLAQILIDLKDVFNSGAETSFERKLIYDACDKINIKYQKYTNWIQTCGCRTHKKKLVPGDMPCCSDLMCHGICPDRKYNEHCDITRWKNKHKNIAVNIVNLDTVDTIQIRNLNLNIPEELNIFWLEMRKK